MLGWLFGLLVGNWLVGWLACAQDYGKTSGWISVNLGERMSNCVKEEPITSWCRYRIFLSCKTGSFFHIFNKLSSNKASILMEMFRHL